MHPVQPVRQTGSEDLFVLHAVFSESMRYPLPASERIIAYEDIQINFVICFPAEVLQDCNFEEKSGGN